MSSTIGRRLLVNWQADPDVIAPLLPEPIRPQVVAGRSSIWDDERRFPRGSVELDSALVMRHLPVRWTAVDAPPQRMRTRATLVRSSSCSATS